MTESADHRQLLDLAVATAREAGAMVHSGRAAGIVDTDTKSSSTDVVTQFDKASERLIVSTILRARPDDAFAGEEGTDVTGISGVRWIVDPIDGTTNFLYDVPGYAISIAAAVDGAVVAGAVYLPSADEMFTAVRGGGAAMNGRTISCGSTSALSQSLVATGFGYLPGRRLGQVRRLQGLITEVRDIRRLGAAAGDLCHLAIGRFDAYYEQYLNEWDIAAGALIASEAGAVVGSFPGFDGEPDGLLAANPLLYPQMHELLAEISACDHGVIQHPPSGIM